VALIRACIRRLAMPLSPDDIQLSQWPSHVRPDNTDVLRDMHLPRIVKLKLDVLNDATSGDDYVFKEDDSG
jgi:hypothetical protein